MLRIEPLLAELPLIYYEFDRRTHTFRIEKRPPNANFGLELVSITHQLQKAKIPYRIAKDKSIRIMQKRTFWEEIVALFREVLQWWRTRNLPIYVLSDKPVEGAKNLAIFTIRPLPANFTPAHYDALIFTSKNGVAVLDSMRLAWKKIPAYAIAPQTAKAIKNRAGNLRYVGKSKHGDSFAHELVPLLTAKRVLYVRGKHVVSSLHTILRTHGITCDEAIIYETVCQEPSKPIVLPKGATIIFSSPSTIHCFLQNVAWDESYHAIAIGRTTAGHFPAHIHPTIADTTSIESCVSKAIAMYERE